METPGGPKLYGFAVVSALHALLRGHGKLDMHWLWGCGGGVGWGLTIDPQVEVLDNTDS